MEDIRKKAFIDSKDVLELNFIRSCGPCTFRRHFRQGLRSHVIEVLRRDDHEKETKGVVTEGIRLYPKAKPLAMLRIFRKKFNSLEEAVREGRKFKTVLEYLGPKFVAMSEEFIVEYSLEDENEILLCGLQEYVEGSVLDPWNINVEIGSDLVAEAHRKETVQNQAEIFISRIKKMITAANRIPDIAGVGNLVLTPSGALKLVDINNVTKVDFGPGIPLDEKGYPVCDKSVEALSLIERDILGRKIDMDDMIYRTFLEPERLKEATKADRKFHQDKLLRV